MNIRVAQLKLSSIFFLKKKISYFFLQIIQNESKKIYWSKNKKIKNDTLNLIIFEKNRLSLRNAENILKDFSNPFLVTFK